MNGSAFLDSLIFYLQEFGYDSSQLDIEKIYKEVQLSKPLEYKIYNNEKIGFGFSDLRENGSIVDLIYIIDLKDGINSFNAKENILNKLIKIIEDNICKFIKDSKDNLVINNQEIDILALIKQLKFNIVFLSNSIKKSLISKSILNTKNEVLELKSLEDSLKEEISRICKIKLIEYNSSKKYSLNKANLEIHFDFYTEDNVQNQEEINILSRTFVTKAVKLQNPGRDGSVYSARLYDLADLFNSKGKSLFLKNIRLGIEDVMGVDTSITKTLEDSPHEFWYMNNGITCLLSKGNIDDSNINSIKVLSGKINNYNLDITVINGAQTISSATKFFINHIQYEKLLRYAEEYGEKIDHDDYGKLECYENELKSIKKIKEKSQEVYNNAVKNAYVMLKVVEIKTEKQEERIIEEIINNITISLNRQKPVLPTDLAYTVKVVSELNSFASSCEKMYKDYVFNIVRRGDATSVNNKRYTLDVLPRIYHMVFNNKPGEAMSKGIKQLLKIKENGKSFDDIHLFPDNSILENKNKEKNNSDENLVNSNVFEKYYKFTNYAMKLYDVLENLQKDYIKDSNSNKKSENINYKKFSTYSRYLLMYTIIRGYYEYINDSDKKWENINELDFSKWDLKSEDVEKKFNIELYKEIIEHCVEKWEDAINKYNSEEKNESKQITKEDYFQLNSFRKDSIIIEMYNLIEAKVKEKIFSK